MLAELSQKQAMKQNVLKIGIKTATFTVRCSETIPHKFSSNEDSDLNENGGGLTDLAKNNMARIGVFA